MRILLDESVPQKLRLLIAGHTVVTVAFQGWSGLKNGALLIAAEEAGFELFITADQAISYQQNLAGRKLAVLVLSTNNWDYVKAGLAPSSQPSPRLNPAATPRWKLTHKAFATAIALVACRVASVGSYIELFRCV